MELETQAVSIMCVVGARPNFVKMAPVVHALRAEPGVKVRICNTGQHYDRALAGSFIEHLDMPRPDHDLGVGSGTHARQTAAVLVGIEDLLLAQRPDAVVVAGDVNSTMGATLAAAKLGIPIVHLESGLRSGDWTMPEEINRVVTDRVSDLLLCHCSEAVDNLSAEGIAPEKVRLVGNTMIDSLFKLLPAARRGDALARHGLEPTGYILVTLHRPALVDDPEQLAAVAEVLAGFADHLPVVFPLHPRTRPRLHAAAPDALARLRVVEPLEYLDFIALQASARLVVTDSGGVQEETSALGIPCLTYRDNTERAITCELGTNRLVGLDPAELARAGAEQLARTPLTAAHPIPMWDGRAGERAAEAILRFVADRRRSATVTAAAA
ncbi:MAG TPA: UDP-N-acetylglucosamine 2-epimerase (non-hydrolyzing) [Solirubrobacteraceae bacterium]|jgi:UDP-N-acetylglucosamine 2-epimerase (non-hydrolysing)